MSKSREAIASDLKKLEDNFKKEFAGQKADNWIAVVLEDHLNKKQRAFVEGVLCSYSGGDAATALEILTEKASGVTYEPVEEPSAPLFKDADLTEDMPVSTAAKKKVMTRKGKGKGNSR